MQSTDSIGWLCNLAACKWLFVGRSVLKPESVPKKKKRKTNPLTQTRTLVARCNLVADVRQQIVNSVAHFIAWAFSQFSMFFSFSFFFFFSFFLRFTALIVTIFVQQLHFFLMGPANYMRNNAAKKDASRLKDALKGKIKV